MKAHPKQQKAKSTPRYYMKKLALTITSVILGLVNFISLTITPFKKLTRENPGKNHYISKDIKSGIKSSRANSTTIHRHWKVDTHGSWEITITQTKLLLLTATLLHVMEDLHTKEINMKTYNLIHNKSFLNQKGNAFPIKVDTMIKNHRRICNITRQKHRKWSKLYARLMECVHHFLNLRFLPQKLKEITINLANMWRFIINHIDIPIERKTAGGPKTICPICTIPVIGVRNYLKQNFRNMTNAIKVAANNFKTKELISKTLSKTLKLTRATLGLLFEPFKRMKIGRLKIRSARKNPGWKQKPRNMGQYDGNDDPEEWSSDSEEENSISATTEDPNADSGWYKKPMKKYPKGVGYWYNPKRPKDKYSELKNAPKMDPPVRNTQAEDIQEDSIPNEEEINITMSETIRTKIVNINVRSAVSDYKKAQIREGIRKIDPDVIAITESWFNKYDQELRMENYIPIGRQDRPPPRNKEPNPKKRGGGVLVLAKK